MNKHELSELSACYELIHKQDARIEFLEDEIECLTHPDRKGEIEFNNAQLAYENQLLSSRLEALRKGIQSLLVLAGQYPPPPTEYSDLIKQDDKQAELDRRALQAVRSRPAKASATPSGTEPAP